ncbi:MAG TPA: cytochrome c oxidase subunit II [Caulobacteraceae bacterium]|nr:cytochrome c oxidase subunit II [Caulobacteraceae bacterium]
MKRAALLMALALGACSGMQTPLAPAADQAEQIRSIWDVMLWVTSFFYLLVIGFLAWAVWRRRRKETAPPRTQVHDQGLERTLAIWAGMIVAGLTLLISWSFLVDRSLASTQDDQALHITVTGAQWWWRVEYTDGTPDKQFETANEIHLPVGETARIKLMTSDVIHSFWVPNLSGKMDMIPGRENVIDITPRKIGVYRGQCAEFCGFQHAHMALTVVVESREDFNRWRNHQLTPAAPPASPKHALGKAVFKAKACSLCHEITGADAGGRTAPNLTHLASRRTIAAGTLPMNRGSLAGWISDPQAIKPGAKMPNVPMSAAESDALVTYLESLK